ncbi:unnamed protein product [Candida verbasci]|uniref:Uncharacterized protein n=1 Tax=Candida verbasci TaxID=1227364 RepID=A0A9W4X9D1_9ASCO|nr:unnamed protein product [Candida verbasci]
MSNQSHLQSQHHQHQLDSRKRQNKRDDAIRRKIEHDLNKKKHTSNNISNKVKHKKAQPGTVLSLKPSDPIICKTRSTVYEVSQIMTAKRENCVLVVNDIGELLGIFTSKDVAFRIVGSGLNANVATIDQIMTPNPICANANNPASEALTLMVEKGFRHLPVLNDENQIVGVLDITKCYAQQMEKLERMHASSKQLYEALDLVHNEMGFNEQPQHIFQYFENLKNKMNGPTLDTVLDHTTIPIYINVKASVYEATILMKENKTTAVLVKDSNDEVAGIFTSKDCVLRVIANGLDPKKCSIIRVMTPQPDVANIHLPIQQALRKMFEGHYLNLPIVGDDDDIIGIVDVLKLTYATLNQIKHLEEKENVNSTQQESSGPAWNKFWTGLDTEDSESIHSDSLLFEGNSSTQQQAPDITPNESQSFNIDLKPSDSISHIDSPTKKQPAATSSIAKVDQQYIFKFKSSAFEGRVHRISLKLEDDLEHLKSLIVAKLHSNDYEKLDIEEDSDSFSISYIDDEGDIVSITSSHDLTDCIKINQKLENEIINLYLHNPNNHPEIEPIKKRKQKEQIKSEFIPGISNEILIPGALAVLATSIIIGFSLSRK